VVERVVVELTQRCNNNCLHCYNYWWDRRSASNHTPVLSRDDISYLIARIKEEAPLNQVALSGGEPFLRRDLADIVCDLTEADLSAVVITNGTMLTESRLSRFPEGTIFEVTLFGAEAELHNRIAGNQVFDKVVEGLVRVERHRCKFALAFVLTKMNAHEVSRTFELAIALGADAALFNRINLSKHMLPLADRLIPSPRQLYDSLAAADEAARRYGLMVAVSVPVPPCLIDPREFTNLHFGWCPRGNHESYYTIGTDGSVRPCNHSSVVLGNLFEESFGEIITGVKTKSFWKPIPEECLSCEHPLKDFCRGGCPAASDECYGTRLKKDPIIEYALKTDDSAVLEVAEASITSEYDSPTNHQ
jgi:radical SAM protein with 4Fe4S-binding SPASM domain